jgi:hypothetical protein
MVTCVLCGTSVDYEKTLCYRCGSNLCDKCNVGSACASFVCKFKAIAGRVTDEQAVNANAREFGKITRS